MRALMPGSYDPCTVGHLALIERAAADYDSVTVAVFINPKKQGLFSFDERMEFLRLATAHLSNVTVAFSDGMVADYAAAGGFTAIVKGIRNEVDRRYEEEMAAYNLQRGGVPTVLLPADLKVAEISSTVVRRALADGTELRGLVPEAARAAILGSYQRKNKTPDSGRTDF